MKFSNYSELRGLLPHLIDARFHREDVTLDAPTGVFIMYCWIPSSSVPEEALSERSSGPKNSWRKVRWSLEKVTSIDVDVTDAVVFYEIGSVDYQAGSGLLAINGHYGIVIKLRTENVAGKFEFLNEYKGKP